MQNLLYYLSCLITKIFLEYTSDYMSKKKMPETLEMQEIPQNSEQNSEYVHISINYEPEKETRKISNRNLILAVVLSSILALGFVIFGVLWYNFSPTAADSNISRNELQQDTHERGTFKTKRF